MKAFVAFAVQVNASFMKWIGTTEQLVSLNNIIFRNRSYFAFSTTALGIMLAIRVSTWVAFAHAA